MLDDLNRQLKPHGLWFPVDVSTASRATIGGMAGNNSCGGRSLRYGTMRDNTISIDAALADGGLLRFAALTPEEARANADEPGRSLFRDLCWPWATREKAGDRRALSQGAAARGRLQSGCRDPKQRRQQYGAYARRLRGDAGVQHQNRAEAMAADPQPRGRRLPFRQLLRGDGRRAASRHARAHRRGTRRPHDDSARPRHRNVPRDDQCGRARRPGRATRGGVRRRGRGREPRAAQAARRADGRHRLRLGQAPPPLGRRGRGGRSRFAGQHRRIPRVPASM